MRKENLSHYFTFISQISIYLQLDFYLNLTGKKITLLFLSVDAG
ncbi:MAG: hypothetical protein ACSI46_07150 [Gloeotrichia echinulata DVL01]